MEIEIFKKQHCLSELRTVLMIYFCACMAAFKLDLLISPTKCSLLTCTICGFSQSLNSMAYSVVCYIL
jgi:hypothetical protein